MNYTFLAPRNYVQGRHLLREAGNYLSKLGQKPLLLWGPTVKRLVGERVLASLNQAGLEAATADFSGQCTKAEAARIAQIATNEGADMIVALGGGKYLIAGKLPPLPPESRWFPVLRSPPRMLPPVPTPFGMTTRALVRDSKAGA